MRNKVKKDTFASHIEEFDGFLFIYVPLSGKSSRNKWECLGLQPLDKVRVTVEKLS